MDVFVARQPIFDRDLKTFGHELLYRSSSVNTYSGADSTMASLEVINNSLFAADIGQISGGRRVFINFDRKLVLSDAASVLDPKKVVIEILEDTEIDGELLDACRKLQERGYLLADICAADQMKPLLDLVDFIKVDVRLSTAENQQRILDAYGNRHTCLAEKLESQEEFEAARKLGYQLFQGYFFARPVIVKGHQISGFKMNYLRILNAVSQPDMDLFEIEKLIRQDASVTYKLLRYVNSALFAQCANVDSIQRALMILGQQELRKWTSIVLLMHLASDQPDALLMCALVRAGFCEKLAELAGETRRKSDLFLMGMFSLLDAMMGCPLPEALRQIRLPEDIQAALLGEDQPSSVTDIYRLVKTYEQGHWEEVLHNASRLKVGDDQIRDTYLGCIGWCEEIFKLLPQLNGPRAPSLGRSPAARPNPPAAPVRNGTVCSHH